MGTQDNDFRDSLCTEITCSDIEDLNTNIDVKNSLLVMHMNIYSIETHFNELVVFLSTLKQ